MKKLLSVIVPCYNEEEALPYFYEKINSLSNEMSDLNFEFIFVNDGSKDNTLKMLKNLYAKDKRVRYISFSRNFGKEAAMMAGFEASLGDYVTVMDADLQDPPAMLKDMYKGILEGYDCVYAKRTSRKGESRVLNFFKRLFYKIINKISKSGMVDGARDYRLMTRQMVNSLLEFKEYNRYSKGLFTFIGYETKAIAYENVPRVAGKSKWNFWKLLKYAIEGILAFSTVPLFVAAAIGILFFIISLIMIVVIVVKTLVWGDPATGWPSLVCIIFLVSGIQLFCTGIIGAYLAKNYMETKKRPVYIIKETERDNTDK